ncbi:MAG: hypothetical protein C0490_03215 [Marivirga sp.]|nr:hypothetical protein [Marivirga sp.]
MIAVMSIAIVGMQLISGCQSASTTLGRSGTSKGTRVVSHQSDNTIVSAILEASLGGEPGSLIEKQMDKQARELKSALKGAKVERLAEGILITMDSRELFEHDSFGLHTTRHLKELARTLKKFNYTNALIESHTASTGEEVYNLSLSEQRAHQVEEFLWKEGIKSARIKAKGYGETQPLTTVNTDAGNAVNRRLEIAIYANEEMKNLAMLGKVGGLTASSGKN